MIELDAELGGEIIIAVEWQDVVVTGVKCSFSALVTIHQYYLASVRCMAGRKFG